MYVDFFRLYYQLSLLVFSNIILTFSTCFYDYVDNSVKNNYCFEMRKLSVEELERIDVCQFKASRKLPLVVVLDNVRSLYNIGSVFRTADAFRIERIVLCGITATPDKCLVEIHKTALGAESTVDWIYVQDTFQAVNYLKQQGYTAVAVEQVQNSEKLDVYEIPEGRYAVILGNEVKGVRQDVVDICDFSLEIPQYGTKHSLNVSVTAGIVMWEFLRQMKADGMTL